MDLGVGRRKKENNLQPEDLLSAVTYIYFWKRLINTGNFLSMILFKVIHHKKKQRKNRDHFTIRFYWCDSETNIINHLPWV